jgi:hypothetical protein
MAIPGREFTDYSVMAAVDLEWYGPGNIILLSESGIRNAITSPDAFHGAVLNVTLHEDGHLVPQGKIANTDDSELFDCELVREYQREKQAEYAALPDPPPTSPDSVHDVAFVRRTVHLWARAAMAGWTIPPDQIFGDSLWFCSGQFPHFLTALLPEIGTMREARFSEIDATAPTESFSELWQNSLKFYESFQEDKK